MTSTSSLERAILPILLKYGIHYKVTEALDEIVKAVQVAEENDHAFDSLKEKLQK